MKIFEKTKLESMVKGHGMLRENFIVGLREGIQNIQSLFLMLMNTTEHPPQKRILTTKQARRQFCSYLNVHRLDATPNIA